MMFALFNTACSGPSSRPSEDSGCPELSSVGPEDVECFVLHADYLCLVDPSSWAAEGLDTASKASIDFWTICALSSQKAGPIVHLWLSQQSTEWPSADNNKFVVNGLPMEIVHDHGVLRPVFDTRGLACLRQQWAGGMTEAMDDCIPKDRLGLPRSQKTVP
jgi:hypothetical protein